jgi:hypothetical protein
MIDKNRKARQKAEMLDKRQKCSTKNYWEGDKVLTLSQVFHSAKVDIWDCGVGFCIHWITSLEKNNINST